MMSGPNATRILLVHLAVVAALIALYFVLPEYHRGNLSRVMVLAVFAMGYNLMFGYTGLLSLGHAMFFAAGIYGAGLTVYHLEWGVMPAFIGGAVAGLAIAVVTGLLALRTSGVAFMIVTMMFAQVFFLTTLYFTTWTRGEEGLVLQPQSRIIELGAATLPLANSANRYFIALSLFAIVLVATLAIARAPFGRVLIAIRENEERMRMLGYDVFVSKLAITAISGLICGAAGAAYALLFGYVGSGFASIQYSILPLLWVLVGGAATVLGPFFGTLAMFYLIDLSNDLLNSQFPGWNVSYLGVVGVALVLLILYFPKGILGTVRERWLKWLP